MFWKYQTSETGESLDQNKLGIDIWKSKLRI